jgi:hypothetical protein
VFGTVERWVQLLIWCLGAFLGSGSVEYLLLAECSEILVVAPQAGEDVEILEGR